MNADSNPPRSSQRNREPLQNAALRRLNSEMQVLQMAAKIAQERGNNEAGTLPPVSPMSLASSHGTMPRTATDTDKQQPTLGMIGQYELVEELGRGGMGVVYKAWHPHLKRFAAIKVLRAEKTNDANTVERFRREISAIGKLSHENIVAADDASLDALGRYYLVMKYLEGATLAKLVQDHGQLAISDACELIRQAAMGLQHAHDKGCVHRDIKPGNLILAHASPVPGDTTNPPVLKIVDFGLTTLTDSPNENEGQLTSEGHVLGTYDYMSPEQFQESHAADERSDVYSLGATFYKLLTGRAPFENEALKNRAQKLAAILRDRPPPVQSFRFDVPLDVAYVVGRMLAKDPEKRYARPQDLVAVLKPYCEGNNLQALLTTPRPASALAETVVAQSTTVVSKPTVKLPRESYYRTFFSKLAIYAVMGCIIFALAYKAWRSIRPTYYTGPYPSVDPNASLRKKEVGAATAKQKWTPPEKSRTTENQSMVSPPLPLPPPAVNAKSKTYNSKEVESAFPLLPAKFKPGEPLRACALIQKPTTLPGIASWTIETRQPRGELFALSHHPQENLLATGGADSTIRLWEILPDQPPRLMRALIAKVDTNNAAIRSLSWSPSGKLLAAGYDDNRMRIWNVLEGGIIASLPSQSSVKAVRWSPNGQYLAFNGTTSGHPAFYPSVWDLHHLGGVRSWPLVMGAHPVFAWHPKGHLLALHVNGSSIVFIDPKQERPVGQFSTSSQDKFQEWVSMEWSPNGALIATADRHGSIKLWDAKLGTQIDIPSSLTTTLGGQSLLWSPRGDSLLSSHGNALDIKSKTITSKFQSLSATGLMAPSADGKSVFLGHDRGDVEQIELRTGQARTIITAAPEVVRLEKWPNDPTAFFAVFRQPDKPAVVWRIEKLKDFPRARKLADVLPSPMVGYYAAIDFEKGSLSAWSTIRRDGSTITSSSVNSTLPSLAVAWSPDGKRLAQLRTDQRITVYSLSKGAHSEYRFEAKVESQPVLSWSPNGARLALIDRTDHDAGYYVWDTSSPENSLPIHAPDRVRLSNSISKVSRVTITPKLAIRWNRSDEVEHLFTSLKQLETLWPAYHVGPYFLDEHPEAGLLLQRGRSFDRYIQSAPLEKRERHFPNLHEGFVYQGLFSGDGKSVATTDGTGILYVWDAVSQSRKNSVLAVEDGSIVEIDDQHHVRITNDETVELIAVLQTEKGQQTVLWKDFHARYYQPLSKRFATQ